MDQHAVDMLLGSLGNLATAVNELMAKVGAAEKVFQAHNPQAYKEYQKYFDSLKKTGATQQLAQALAKLRAVLMLSDSGKK